LGFGLLVIGAQTLIARPISSAILLAAGALTLGVLIRREWPKPTPLIPLDLLRVRSFTFSVLASVLCFTGQTIALVTLSFYLQHNLGLSPWRSGLLLMPWPLAVASTALFMGPLLKRLPTSMLCMIGGVILSLGLAGAAFSPLQDDPLWLAPFTALCGLGFGLFQVPNNRNMFMSAPIARSGAAGGMQGTARLLGQTSGAVLMSLLFAVMSAQNAPRIGLTMGAVFALAAAVVSLARAKSADQDVTATAAV
jgi:DHA2 family multidrug resistance protein-like MFS transporter